MRVTEHWSFRSQPRIDRRSFRSYAFDHFAERVLAERDPGEYWDAIVARGIDPAYILAVFMHESSYGRAGVAVRSKSWGNTRPPSFGVAQIGQEADFSFYSSWLDGCISTCARLNEHVYHGRFTIRQVYIWEPAPTVVWAPSNDGNDPDGYLGTVLAEMNRIKTHDGDVGFIDGFAKVPEVVVDFLSGEQLNVEGVDYPYAKFVGVTNHETDNADGADALSHARYLKEGAQTAKGTPSWHFTVDENRIVMHLPLNWRAYHAGDNLGPGSWTYAVELCSNRGPVAWETILRNAAWLNAQLLRIVALQTGQSITGWNVSDVLSQHNRWSGKDCPYILRKTGRWSENVVRTTRALTTTVADQPEKPEFRFFPETGHSMGHGFLRAWEDRGAVAAFGYPLTEEFYDNDLGLVVQYTERARFEFHPDWKLEDRVALGRVGAELMDAQAEIERLKRELAACLATKTTKTKKVMSATTEKTSPDSPSLQSPSPSGSGATSSRSRTKRPKSPTLSTSSASSPPSGVVAKPRRVRGQEPK